MRNSSRHHHEFIKQLLPWFVNGTLNESEQTEVNLHIKECDVCQADVNSLIQISFLFSTAQTFDDASSRVSRVDARHRFISALNDPDEKAPDTPLSIRQLSRTAALAVAVVPFFAISLLAFYSADDKFVTLGSPGVESMPVMQIVFNPDATEQTIRQILLADGNRVLSGPSQSGVYRVGIGAGRNSEILLAKLKHDPDILFAQLETP